MLCPQLKKKMLVCGEWAMPDLLPAFPLKQSKVTQNPHGVVSKVRK